ncbi:MAG: CHASE2 domain-containing protein, partial [Candidatus Riflebacteria bacterium]|nr:CHASE2 domain-containing protein [Candidatus Riflebacteria bacterium]
MMAELAIICAVIIVTYGLSSTRFHALAELWTYDFRLVFRPQRQTAAQVIYMNIDDASLLKFGRWPWPRSHFAQIVSTLRRFGAKTVFLDIEFPEESPRVLKETISGQGFLHTLDVFRQGAIETVNNVQRDLSRKFDQTTAGNGLEGLKGYVDLQVRGLQSELEQAIVNPDLVFADSLRKCGNVYSVFFVQEPFARVLVDELNRLKGIEAFLKEHPETPFEKLPAHLRKARDSLRLYERAKLGVYLRQHVEAPSSLAAKDLGFDPEWVSREVETARQGVLQEAIGKAVRESPTATFEEVVNWVVKSLSIKNAANYEEFMRKFFAKASSQQAVRDHYSLARFADDRLSEMASSDDFQPPIPLFVRQFRGLGFSNVKPDVDGSIRSVPLFWRLG